MMKKWTQLDLNSVKMRGQKDLMTMKKGVNKIENRGENGYKLLQKCQITDFCKTNRPTLGQIISGTKCDRDKPIFSAEREGQ